MEIITRKSVAQILAKLIRYSLDKIGLNYFDSIYAQNQLIELFDIEVPAEIPEKFEGDLYRDIINPLCNFALQEKMIEDYEVERFKTKFMGFVTPSPSVVIDTFDKINAKEGIRSATAWLNELSVNTGYINQPLIDRNPHWDYPSENGDLVITINTARPEKDPKEIALSAKSKKIGYPKCMLCVENMGYSGRIDHPARQNLRYIPIALDDDSTWYMQFSPYRYFKEHCIFFNEKHQPMALGEESFARMVELLKNVPHYFIGSNAPLPIVGGSILAHDHYQGGAKEMPVFKASPKKQYTCKKFPELKFSIIDWYNSLIRIKGKDSGEVVKAMAYINDCWASYSDRTNEIFARTGDVQHNAITPIVRLERGELYADLFLRNNRTDAAHPFGIFHPTEELHHIKKEGIGVIEVMGTFILPGRLSSYIRQIFRYVVGTDKYDENELNNPNHPLYGFRDVIKVLVANYNKDSLDLAQRALMLYISKKCVEVLRATAVFKDTKQGNTGFYDFMKYMGMEEAEYSPNRAKKNQNFKYRDNNRKNYNNNSGYKSRNQANSEYQSANQSDENNTMSPSEVKVETNEVEEVNNVSVETQNSENAEQVAVTADAPKKRGRKPKAITENEDAENSEPKRLTADAPKKRGRKPKQDNENEVVENTSVPASENNEVAEEEPTKRKRGRPRKNPV